MKELLRDVGETKEPPGAATTVDHGNGAADGAIEHPIPRDCEDAATLGAERGGDEHKWETACHSSVYLRSDSSILDEQGRWQGCLGNPPTSVPDAEAGFGIFNSRWLISRLIEVYNLGLLPSTRRRIVLSLVLHYQHYHPLVPPYRQYLIH